MKRAPPGLPRVCHGSPRSNQPAPGLRSDDRPSPSGRGAGPAAAGCRKPSPALRQSRCQHGTSGAEPGLSPGSTPPLLRAAWPLELGHRPFSAPSPWGPSAAHGARAAEGTGLLLLSPHCSRRAARRLPLPSCPRTQKLCTSGAQPVFSLLLPPPSLCIGPQLNTAS